MIKKRNRRHRTTYQQVLMIASIFTIILIMLYLLAHRQSEQDAVLADVNNELLTPQVLAYEPLVKYYAEINHMTSDINILLAIVRQESNGQVADVMQSSESAGYPPNYFTQPEESIAQGVYYYATIKQRITELFPNQNILTNEQKIHLAMQSYNFGKGFVDYVAQVGQFNDRVIINFANEQDSSCSQEKRQMYGACYGDIYYYQHVMRYVNISENIIDGTWISQ